MSRDKFIKDLTKLWKNDGNEKRPLELEDCACLGMDGASESYLHLDKVTKVVYI